LLKPGYLPAEIGYCLMPDKAVMLAHADQDAKRHADMVEWWFVRA